MSLFTTGTGTLPAARNAGGIEGTLPSLIQILLTDGASEDLAQSCVVPGVTCTYRRIPDRTHGCPLDFREGQNELRGLERQMPLLKLASQDSGMEMVVGDSSLATLSGLSQDSLNLEPRGSPELPPVQLDRLLARQKLERVLERSREFPSSSGRRGSLQLLSKPVGGVPTGVFVEEQESTEADTELEAGLEEAKEASIHSSWLKWSGVRWGGESPEPWLMGTLPPHFPWSSLGVGRSLPLIDGCVIAFCLTSHPAVCSHPHRGGRQVWGPCSAGHGGSQPSVSFSACPQGPILLAQHSQTTQNGSFGWL